ncbi:hypothetical protein [Desulfonatronum lacustre]|uniref:hypothetical protein n=1 Tax=Desulfonatronum lacustre TaxID=66849 RepID=UPI00048AE2F7|nr:hypothetical protein [Desulfonatronum lacustre]
MARNLREVLAEFSPEDRKDIEVQAAVIIREEHARREQRSQQTRTKATGPVRSNTLTQVPAHR